MKYAVYYKEFNGREYKITDIMALDSLDALDTVKKRIFIKLKKGGLLPDQKDLEPVKSQGGGL